MQSGIYQAAAAMGVAEHKQEVVANNLAHMNVPGFRKSMVVVQTFDNALLEAAGDSEYGTIDRIEEIATDFTPGAFASTGRTLDVALDGDAFFVLDGPDGPLYTRNGGFHISSEGELVNNTGRAVQGDGGPISIPTNASPGTIEIATDGSLRVAGNPAGKIRVVSFDDNSQLRPAGTTVFRAQEGQTPQDAEVAVMQGYRESSNVSAVHEMIEMITNIRSHEAAERVLKALDNAMQQTTNPQGG